MVFDQSGSGYNAPMKINMIENDEAHELIVQARRRKMQADLQALVQTEPIAMWEILVPTTKRIIVGSPYYTTRFHRVWDAKVRAITGGL